MARFRVKLYSDTEIRAKLREAGLRMSELSGPTRAAAEEIAANAEALAAKRTGVMSTSNKVTIRRGWGQIHNSVKYARYQEYGTKYMNKHPFMRPALASVDVVRYYDEHVDDVIMYSGL